MARRTPAGSFTMSWPRIFAVPEVGAIMVDIIRRVVVFPAPFAPRRPKTSLSRHSKLMPSTARIVPRDSSRKVFVRSQTTTGASTAGSACKGPPVFRVASCPAPHESAYCAARTVGHEVFSLHKNRGEAQCHRYEEKLHRDGDRDRLPIEIATNRLSKHQGHVHHGDKGDPVCKFLSRTLNEYQWK